MKKQDADKIKPLVNNHASLEALEHYLQLRVEALKESLLSVPTWDQAIKAQAAVEELKRFRHLRDEVNNAKD